MKYSLLSCYTVLILLSYTSCANVYRRGSLRSLELMFKYLDLENTRSVDALLVDNNSRSNTNERQKPANRVKRYVMKHGKCAIGYAWYGVRCWPCNEYERIAEKPCES